MSTNPDCDWLTYETMFNKPQFKKPCGAFKMALYRVPQSELLVWFRDDLPADRRCRQVKHVDARSHRALPRSKEGLDRVESSVLHGHDHDRGRQHRRQHGVLETIGKVFSGYNQRE